MKVSGEYLTFPGGGTQFKHGALHYIEFIEGVSDFILINSFCPFLLPELCTLISCIISYPIDLDSTAGFILLSLFLIPSLLERGGAVCVILRKIKICLCHCNLIPFKKNYLFNFLKF